MDLQERESGLLNGLILLGGFYGSVEAIDPAADILEKPIVTPLELGELAASLGGGSSSIWIPRS